MVLLKIEGEINGSSDHTNIKRKELNGIVELFSYFTFNRSVNQTIQTREALKLKFKKDLFKPKIDKESKKIAIGLMNKYWEQPVTKFEIV